MTLDAVTIENIETDIAAPAAATPTVAGTFNFDGADGFSSYTVDGNAGNPTLTVTRGSLYTFTNSTGSHPIRLRLDNGGDILTAFNSNSALTTGNSADFAFTVANGIPEAVDGVAQIEYYCTQHSDMVGKITITG